MLTDIFTFCADTRWPSETDSESVDETTPAERKPKINSQTNKAGQAYDGGQQFEVKMAALIGLRGMQRGDDFELATNVKDAGNFDDLVYTKNDRRYCLQLKHTPNPGTNKLTQPELVSLLHKCFEGYKTMTHKDQSVLIIYTNKLLGPRLAKHNTAKADVDSIFKTSDEGKIFKFIPEKDKRSDIYTLLEKSLMESEQYSYLTHPKEEIKDFFNKLIIFTGQKDQWKLDHLIAEEIRNHDAIEVDPTEYKSILQLFKEPLETWWRSKKRENMTPDMLNAWLQRAKTQYYTPLVRRLFEICKRKIVRTGIKFSHSEILRFQAELSNNSAVHLRSDALPLCGTLLLDCLPQPKRIFVNFECLQTQTDELLYAWLRGVWQWLIVSCDSTAEQSHVSHICEDIREGMRSVTSTKCLIVLTHCSVQGIQAFTPIDHRFEFEQLSQGSQEVVLDKTIDFQGCEVTMRSVLQRHGYVGQVLGPEMVTDLLTEGTSINIGGKLQGNRDYYADRVLKRKIWLPLDILRKRGTYPDVFAMRKLETSTLMKILQLEMRRTVPSSKKADLLY
ncbi:hypothetical protein Cfor_11167 [Coptotermes formosanus]|uniref:Uncharacterized protein n=1 Tax=Coptotermes formosanus TaxID=36987 RepID=A0A6L2Q0E7_COPFO|nr:hypothetical protein Cfor_11167 [Coptotermes formosanus]